MDTDVRDIADAMRTNLHSDNHRRLESHCGDMRSEMSQQCLYNTHHSRLCLIYIHLHLKEIFN